MTKRSKAELDRAADTLPELDPDVEAVQTDALDDLRALAEAAAAVETAQVQVTEAVSVARSRGRSWGRIGIALGISRQAARQRFGALDETHQH